MRLLAFPLSPLLLNFVPKVHTNAIRQGKKRPKNWKARNKTIVIVDNVTAYEKQNKIRYIILE